MIVVFHTYGTDISLKQPFNILLSALVICLISWISMNLCNYVCMSDERPGLQVTSRDRLSEGAGEGLSSPVHSLSVWRSQAELCTTPADTRAGPVPSCHTHCRQDALVRLRASYYAHTHTHCCQHVTLHLYVLSCLSEDLLRTHLSSLQQSVIFVCMYFPVFAFYSQKHTVSKYADMNAWGRDDRVTLKSLSH